MPRNHHTKAVREYQRVQMMRREKELATLALKLHCEWAQSTASPFIDEAKERRRARLAHNKQHNSNHIRTTRRQTTQTLGRSRHARIGDQP